MSTKTIFLAILFAVLVMPSCEHRANRLGVKTEDNATITIQPRPDGNAVYYWKTRFLLNESEQVFLREHKVRRIYLRFFDVDVSEDLAGYTQDVVPIGTVAFESPKPDSVEIVPAVFITVPALGLASYQENGIDSLAGRIVTRILNMADYHDLGPIREIQLDCDWTESMRATFYWLCSCVRKRLHKQGIALSATIRLHQLRQEVPPVDRGVLMVYNTGSIQRQKTKNSILDETDVRQYLKGSPVKYELPLDFAWPTYGWGVWFRDGKFIGLIHNTDYSDTSRYARQADGTLLVLREHLLEGHTLLPGDYVRPENSPYTTVAAVKSLVVQSFPDQPHNNILYHLDSLNLSHYTSDEIQSLFSR